MKCWLTKYVQTFLRFGWYWSIFILLCFLSPGKPILQTIIKIKTYARETQIKNAYHVSMTCTHLRNAQTKSPPFSVLVWMCKLIPCAKVTAAQRMACAFLARFRARGGIEDFSHETRRQLNDS